MSQEEDYQAKDDEEREAGLQEQLWSLQEAHEALESERNEWNRKVETLEDELAAAATECQESESNIQALREENDSLAGKNQTLEHPDTIALKFLEANCSNFLIRKDKSGGIVVEGTLEGPQCGYVTKFIPRIQRSNGKPPYLIHEDDTYRQYRTVQFKYTALDETIAQAVEGVIVTYCPGDVEVGRQAFEDNRYCDYGDGQHTWVHCCVNETLEEFQKLKEVGEDPDLTDATIRNNKVPGR